MTLRAISYKIKVSERWEVIFIKALVMKILSLILCLAVFVCPVSALASSSQIAQTEKLSAKGNIFESSISEIKAMLEREEITSQELCEVYIERINKYDKAGVKLNSVISLNKNAVALAKQMDSERKAGHSRGVLHGIPI